MTPIEGQGLAATGHVAKPMESQVVGKEFKLGSGTEVAASKVFSNVVSSQRQVRGSVSETISNNVKTRQVAQRFFASLR